MLSVIAKGALGYATLRLLLNFILTGVVRQDPTARNSGIVHVVALIGGLSATAIVCVRDAVMLARDPRSKVTAPVCTAQLVIDGCTVFNCLTVLADALAELWTLPLDQGEIDELSSKTLARTAVTVVVLSIMHFGC